MDITDSDLPLIAGNGLERYSGVQREIASTLSDLTRLYNGPKSPSLVPDALFYTHVDDIRPVSESEKSQCKDSSYISSDPSDPHYYTATITEGYFGLLKKQTTYIGCNPTDYIYVQFFGYPQGGDPRKSSEY